MSSSWPVVAVTGANSGVGFGICERFLIQLAQRSPLDAQPQLVAFDVSGEQPKVQLSDCEGLTLVMACRSTKRAEIARAKLYRILDAYIAQLNDKHGDVEYAQNFRKNLRIEVHYLDLAIMDSIFHFADELSHKYPYISHLICNAGVASFAGIDRLRCYKQLFASPLSAVTAPEYYLQHKGETSADGLGWVWQCNLFGHYVLFRAIRSQLLSSKSSLGSRVLWTSSLEAAPTFYDSDDWQLIKTEHSYESVKYQIDLISTHLDGLALQETGSNKIVRHLVVQPGVVSTNISHALTGWVTNLIKVALFYVARFFGSPHHTIVPYKSAVSAVHLSIVSLLFVPIASAFGSNHPPSNGGRPESLLPHPVRFGSETGPWGDERVGVTEVKEWEKNKKEAAVLVEKCEQLYQRFQKKEGNLANSAATTG